MSRARQAIASWCFTALLFAGAASAGQSSQAAMRTDTLQARLDADVPALLADQHVPSVSIAHLENGRIVLAAAYGTQSPGVPATKATLYNVASLTKPISAEVVLRLASRERLSLDARMFHRWIDPDIADDRRNRLLTPRLMLSHASGFPNWRYETGGVLKFIRTPGQAFGYSGEGFEYMARFTAIKLNRPFEQLAQVTVFDRAGMHDTAYTARPWFDGRIALPTDAEGKALPPQFAEEAIASDQLYTTASDYARFIASVIRHQGVTAAIADQRSSIQVDRMAELCPPERIAVCPIAAGFGLGWEVFKFETDVFLMHTGMDPGVFTFAYFSPKTGTGTVILSNSSNGPKIVIPILERLGKDPAFLRFLRRLAE